LGSAAENRDNPCAEFSDCHSDEIWIGVLRPPFVKLCFYNVHQFPSMLQKLPDGCDVAAALAYISSRSSPRSCGYGMPRNPP
jgi:hypothetical protein